MGLGAGNTTPNTNISTYSKTVNITTVMASQNNKPKVHKLV